MTTLEDTDAAGIAAEFIRARTLSGSPAMGMVLTLVVVAPEDAAAEAMSAAREASHEHPARVLGVVLGDRRPRSRVDAEVGIGAGWTGETAVLRLSGEVVDHADSVVSPLLLPDSPVAVWWPVDPPAEPALDPIGGLAQRRIIDSAAATTGRTTVLVRQCCAYSPGTTDLAWTRLTRWRALLASALDQHPAVVTGAVVEAERFNPSADLMAAWIASRLDIQVTVRQSDGPGMTRVALETEDGSVEIRRPDGRLAVVSSPSAVPRPMALARRGTADLLAEELRRLDEDDVYAEVAAYVARSEEE